MTQNTQNPPIFPLYEEMPSRVLAKFLIDFSAYIEGYNLSDKDIARLTIGAELISNAVNDLGLKKISMDRKRYPNPYFQGTASASD